MFSLVISFLLALHVAALPYRLQGVDIVSGKAVEAEAKSAVVVFLSAKCPCSHDHTGELAELAKTYPQYKFFGVHSNADETAAETKAYFEKLNLPFPVVQDAGAAAANHFKALKTPHVFVLNSAGETVYQGGVSDSKDFERSDRKYLREALKDLHENKPVKTAAARSLGCAIKRK
jgi:hypothetical protein